MKNYLMYPFLLVIGLITLTGCPPPENNARVNIVYDQVANFHVYKTSSSAFSSTSAGNGMFIQYKISQISNTGSNAKPFVFKVSNIITTAAGKISNGEPPHDHILILGKSADNITVQPGQVLSDVGCIIKHVLTDSPESLANTSALVDLTHKIDNSQPVSMKRSQSDNTTAVVSNAVPSALKSLCNIN